MKHSMAFDQWDLVVVPFPFLEIQQEKKRPVLVLSSLEFQHANASFIGAMVTVAGKSQWSGDTPIEDIESAGLQKPCVVRLKLFTLPTSLQPQKIGTLSSRDKKAFQTNWKRYLVS